MSEPITMNSAQNIIAGLLHFEEILHIELGHLKIDL